MSCDQKESLQSYNTFKEYAVKRPGEQLGVQCLAQGHFEMQLAGIEPTTLLLQDNHSPH